MVGRPVASIFKRARSVSASLPMTFGWKVRPSASWTSIDFEPSTTWWFVTM